jgi:small subunit ribosomal protein S20
LANIKQALKRHRQSVKARNRNRVVKSHVKNAIKEVRSAIDQQDKEIAQKALQKASSVLDKAAAKKVLHWKNAARRISRLNSAVNKLS